MIKYINPSVFQKIRDLKETVDKYITVILGCLWTISTLWDIVTFQCFWSDYMLEIYSAFFIIFMVIQVIFPEKVPKIITEYIGIISTVLGRGIIMIIFSLIFLGDKHIFHKLCSIFLFVGGIFLLILGLLFPLENDNINKLYPSQNPESSIDDNIPKNYSINNTP